MSGFNSLHIDPENMSDMEKMMSLYFVRAFLCFCVSAEGVTFTLLGDRLEGVHHPIGSVLSLLMEGLYSKNQVMVQFSSSSCLMLIIDAFIGDIFTPFLLMAWNLWQ